LREQQNLERIEALMKLAEIRNTDLATLNNQLNTDSMTAPQKRIYPMITDKVWQDTNLVNSFLTGLRGGVPFAAEQINIPPKAIAHTRILAKRWPSPRRPEPWERGCGAF